MLEYGVLDESIVGITNFAQRYTNGHQSNREQRFRRCIFSKEKRKYDRNVRQLSGNTSNDIMRMNDVIQSSGEASVIQRARRLLRFKMPTCSEIQSCWVLAY